MANIDIGTGLSKGQTVGVVIVDFQGQPVPETVFLKWDVFVQDFEHKTKEGPWATPVRLRDSGK